MHAPEINDYIKHEAAKLDKVSDAIDEVNILKLKQKDAVEKTQAEIEYDLASKFDQEKDKAAFRQYEDACDRVKNFYAVKSFVATRHNLCLTRYSGATLEADLRI